MVRVVVTCSDAFDERKTVAREIVALILRVANIPCDDSASPWLDLGREMPAPANVAAPAPAPKPTMSISEDAKKVAVKLQREALERIEKGSAELDELFVKSWK